MDIVKFSTERLIEIVSDLIISMTNTNNKLCAQITHFDSRTVPSISILSYLKRIHKYTPFNTNEILLSVLIYFDRLSKLIIINSYNIHRLLIASIVVASKFNSDIFYSNGKYARVGGISLQELNQLEFEFLFLINFKLHVSTEKLQAYADQLLAHSISSIEYTLPTSKADTCHHSHKHHHHLSYHTHSINVTMPLTPPYTHNSINKKFHPYQKPQKKKLVGLISPK